MMPMWFVGIRKLRFGKIESYVILCPKSLLFYIWWFYKLPPLGKT